MAFRVLIANRVVDMWVRSGNTRLYILLKQIKMKIITRQTLSILESITQQAKIKPEQLISILAHLLA